MTKRHNDFKRITISLSRALLSGIVDDMTYSYDITCACISLCYVFHNNFFQPLFATCNSIYHMLVISLLRYNLQVHIVTAASHHQRSYRNRKPRGRKKNICRATATLNRRPISLLPPDFFLRTNAAQVISFDDIAISSRGKSHITKKVISV